MNDTLHTSKPPAVIALILYLTSTLVLWSRELVFVTSEEQLLTSVNRKQIFSATVAKGTCFA